MSAAPQAEFRHETRDGDATLVVIGEIDFANSAAFRDELHTLIEAAHSPALVDLTDLRFLDSSGVVALVDAHGVAEEVGVHIALLKPTRVVRKMLDITGMSRVIDIRA
jgi:anti-anti-sigma factor